MSSSSEAYSSVASPSPDLPVKSFMGGSTGYLASAAAMPSMAYLTEAVARTTPLQFSTLHFQPRDAPGWGMSRSTSNMPSSMKDGSVVGRSTSHSQ